MLDIGLNRLYNTRIKQVREVSFQPTTAGILTGNAEMVMPVVGSDIT